MKSEADITKIELSPSEIKKLKWIAKNEPIDLRMRDADILIQRLYKRDLLEVTYCKKFPYESIEGFISIPRNALIMSDLGLQYLNRMVRMTRNELINRIIGIAAIAMSGLSLFWQITSWLMQA